MYESSNGGEHLTDDDSEVELCHSPLDSSGTPDTHGDHPVSGPPPRGPCGFEATKAGLAGVDRAHVNAIIEEASRGSPFYVNQQRRDAKVQARLAEMRAKLDRVAGDKALMQSTLRTIDSELQILEDQRDLTRVVVHVDMDAFYAAVEARDNPALANVPMAVGSLSMLSTSNYAARKFGVRSAMPGYIARRLCPELVIVPVNFTKYRAVGEEIREIFAEYDPHFRSVSCDEACMDCTDYARRRAEAGDPVEPAALAAEIRTRVFARTALTASAGVATNRLLAKMCTDLNKPNGQFVLPPTREAILQFLEDAPVRKIPGIGRVTETLLGGLGIRTGRDLFEHRAALSHVFGPKSFDYLLRASRGLLDGGWVTEEETHRKSLSAERTFGKLHSEAELWEICKRVCASVAADLTEKGLRGRVVTVKMKRTTFEVRQRSLTLPRLTADAQEIQRAAVQLLRQEGTPLDLRLLGVRLSNFDGFDPEPSRDLQTFFRPRSDAPSTNDEAIEPIPADADAVSTNEEEPSIEQPCPICGTTFSKPAAWWAAHADACLDYETARTSLPKKNPNPPFTTSAKRRKTCSTKSTLQSFFTDPKK